MQSISSSTSADDLLRKYSYEHVVQAVKESVNSGLPTGCLVEDVQLKLERKFLPPLPHSVGEMARHADAGKAPLSPNATPASGTAEPLRSGASRSPTTPTETASGNLQVISERLTRAKRYCVTEIAARAKKQKTGARNADFKTEISNLRTHVHTLVSENERLRMENGRLMKEAARMKETISSLESYSFTYRSTVRKALGDLAKLELSRPLVDSSPTLAPLFERSQDDGMTDNV